MRANLKASRVDNWIARDPQRFMGISSTIARNFTATSPDTARSKIYSRPL